MRIQDLPEYNAYLEADAQRIAAGAKYTSLYRRYDKPDEFEVARVSLVLAEIAWHKALHALADAASEMIKG